MSFINRLLQTVESQVANAIGKQTKTADDIVFKPGDITIEDITLQSRDLKKQFPLMDHAKVIDIFESVLSPVIFAEIGIADAIGLKQSFPILGGEYITIKFKTPGNKKSTFYKFIIQSITNVTTVPSAKMITYTIKCVSAEILRNATRLIDRIVDGVLSDAISIIIDEDLGTTKNKNIEKTQGVEKHTITRLHPFIAIDYLRQRATSTRYKSSSYAFFENKNGYNFVTMESLLEKGQKGLENSSNKFFYDTMRNEDATNDNWRDILAYNYIISNDLITQAHEGGFNNTLKTFDIITGNYAEYKYDDSKGADQFKTSDKNSHLGISTKDIKEFSANNARSKIVAVNPDISNEKLGEKYVNAQAFAQKLTQNILQIQIYGDNNLTVSDAIEVTLPSATGMDDDSGKSRLDSGNYLITKLRHTIINGDRPQHTISLELIKQGLTR